MSKRQVTLFSIWQTIQSRQARIEPEETNRSSEFEDTGSITVLFYTLWILFQWLKNLSIMISFFWTLLVVVVFFWFFFVFNLSQENLTHACIC